MKFELRDATPWDFEFAFEVKRDAMGPHISARWGWDEAFQLQLHRKRWNEKPWQVVLVGSARVGTVSVHMQPTHVQFGEFYVLGPYRRQGLGTQVLRQALELADRNQLETRLECLKWNPVASLYTRNGFRIVDEDEIHYFMVRGPHEA